jgi:hypothetical protein
MSLTRGRQRSDGSGMAGQAATQRRRGWRSPTTPRTRVNPRRCDDKPWKSRVVPTQGTANDTCPLACALPPSCRLCQQCSAWRPVSCEKDEPRARGRRFIPVWLRAGIATGVCDRVAISIDACHAGCSSTAVRPAWQTGPRGGGWHEPTAAAQACGMQRCRAGRYRCTDHYVRSATVACGVSRGP